MLYAVFGVEERKAGKGEGKMSFKLTIEVSPSKLMGTLRLLNGHKVYVESTETYKSGWDDPRKKTKGHNSNSRADSRLTMTGKTAQEGTKIEMAMGLFEKLEKRKGIGTVTVRDFRDHLVKNEQSKGLAQRVITEKFMTYL